MKIDSATCRKGDTRDPEMYLATVTVSSDGVQYASSQRANSPDEAIHKALSAACAEHTQALHKKVSTEVSVKF